MNILNLTNRLRTNQYIIPTFDIDYQAILDEGTLQGYTLPSSGQQTVQNAIVVALKAHGLWSGIDAMWYFKGDGGADFKKINWKNPTGTKAVEFGAGALTYSSTGVLGDNVNYLNLGWNPTDDGVNYTQNNFSIWFDIVTAYTSGSAILEGMIGASRSLQIINQNSYMYLHSTGTTSRSIINVSSTGFFIIDFLTDTSYASKDGGASFDTEGSKVTDSLPNIDFNLFKIGTTNHGDEELGSIVLSGSLSGNATNYSNAYNSIINGI